MGAKTYYFDGSDAGATDPDSAWTNDANAFDGDITTSATASGIAGASNSTKFLKAEGTNAPADGPKINQVFARMFAASVAPDGHTHSAEIYTDGLGESLGTVTKNSGSTNDWGSWTELSIPSGGWTWAVLQALEVKIWANDAGTGTPAVYRVEIKVNPSAQFNIYTTQGFQ